MFLIFIIILISTVNSRFLFRTDCYVSFSDPIIYIKLSHYNPSGPFYLYSTFMYTRYSYIPGIGPKDAKINHHFKRVNDTCIPSTLFSTLGKDFQRLCLRIIIYLYKGEFHIADIVYTFYRGFKPGSYKMFDKNQHFSLHTQVLDVTEEHLKVPSGLPGVAIHYLSSISATKSATCLITENNPVVVLKFSYDHDVKQGYITGFMVEIFKNGHIISAIYYSAFECNSDEAYPDENIIFVTDGEEFTLNLYTVDWRMKKSRINSNSLKFDYVYNLQYIPQDYIKVFLMDYKLIFTHCLDRSRPTVFLSRNNITYITRVYNWIQISFAVKFIRIFYRSPFNLCGLKNK